MTGRPAWRRGRTRHAAVAFLLVVLAACGGGESTRNEDGVVVNAGSWSVFDLHVGDCLAPEPDLTGEISEIPVVPCDQAHAQEVFATVEHPADAYPGAGAVAAWADGACLTQLQDDLGYGLEDGLYISYLLPTFDGWNTDDDRNVVCVLVSPDAEGSVGSYVAGTATLARAEVVLPADPASGDDADTSGDTTDDGEVG
ncbi:MAG TPA: septum formation family protein [Egicoccus sp.]|nr:septum formation family protein [Egicoccus sp.]HSK24914.1 septum formation family protein [Egicoccus sp.]